MINNANVNQALTGVSVAYIQDNSRFIASRVFPNVPVDKQSDLYYVWNRSDFNRALARKRAPSTESAGMTLRLSTETYYAHVWALHIDIDDQARANWDNQFDQDKIATRSLTNSSLLSREVDFATNFLKTGVWGSDVTGVASGPGANQALKWSDASSDPIADVESGMQSILQKTGFEPNTLTVGYNVFNKLKNHPDIIDRVKFTQNIGANGAVKVSEQALAMLFGVERMFVIKAIQNTAPANVDTPTAETNVFVGGGNDALLTYSPADAGPETPSAGYTFSWRGLIGAQNEGVRIKRFRMEAIESDRIEAEMAYAQKIVAPELGYFWDEIV